MMIGKMKKTKKTNGNEELNSSNQDSLIELFNTQMLFQNIVTKEANLPEDALKWFSYHMQAMIEELGELMKSDKRWKTHRRGYDPENKEEEIADVFITFMNICMFSDVGPNKLYAITKKKIEENFKKLGNTNE